MLNALKRIIFLAVASLAAYIAYTRLKPRPIPVDALHTDGRFVTVDGLRIHYQAAGSGPPLILIHGIGANLFTWRIVFDALAQEYAVYALDLKGHGLSDKPGSGDYSPFGMADLVAGFMDALGIESANVIGLSMGGAITLALAARHPARVRQVVAISPAGYPLDYHVMPVAAHLAGTWLGSAIVAFMLRQRRLIELYLRQNYYEPDRMCTPEAVDGYFLPLLTPGLGGVIPRLARDFGQTSIAHRLRDIAAPTLILWGQHDAIIPMHWGHRFAQDISNAELVVFPKCGHCLQEEQPERFLETVHGFFQQDTASEAALSRFSDPFVGEIYDAEGNLVVGDGYVDNTPQVRRTINARNLAFAIATNEDDDGPAIELGLFPTPEKESEEDKEERMAAVRRRAMELVDDGELDMAIELGFLPKPKVEPQPRKVDRDGKLVSEAVAIEF